MARKRTGLGIQTRTGAYGRMLSVNVSEGMANDLKEYADITKAPSMNAAVRQLIELGLSTHKLPLAPDRLLEMALFEYVFGSFTGSTSNDADADKRQFALNEQILEDLKAYTDETDAPGMTAALFKLLVLALDDYHDAKGHGDEPERNAITRPFDPEFSEL